VQASLNPGKHILVFEIILKRARDTTSLSMRHDEALTRLTVYTLREARHGSISTRMTWRSSSRRFEALTTLSAIVLGGLQESNYVLSQISPRHFR